MVSGPPFVCEIKACRRSFPSIEKYRKHMNDHKVKSWYKCEYCGKMFPKRFNMQRHMSMSCRISNGANGVKQRKVPGPRNDPKLRPQRSQLPHEQQQQQEQQQQLQQQQLQQQQVMHSQQGRPEEALANTSGQCFGILQPPRAAQQQQQQLQRMQQVQQQQHYQPQQQQQQQQRMPPQLYGKAGQLPDGRPVIGNGLSATDWTDRTGTEPKEPSHGAGVDVKPLEHVGGLHGTPPVGATTDAEPLEMPPDLLSERQYALFGGDSFTDHGPRGDVMSAPFMLRGYDEDSDDERRQLGQLGRAGTSSPHESGAMRASMPGLQYGSSGTMLPTAGEVEGESSRRFGHREQENGYARIPRKGSRPRRKYSGMESARPDFLLAREVFADSVGEPNMVGSQDKDPTENLDGLSDGFRPGFGYATSSHSYGGRSCSYAEELMGVPRYDTHGSCMGTVYPAGSAPGHMENEMDGYRSY